MHYKLGFFCCLFFFACSNDKQPANAVSGTTDAVGNISGLLTSYWEERMKLFPLEATQNGDNRYNDQLSLDISEPFRDTLRRFYKDYQNRIQQIDTAQLGESDRISYDIFKREMSMQLEGLQLNDHLIPFQQFWGLPLTMGQLGSGEGSQPFKTAQDYHNWLGRVNKFPAWADTAIANFKKGIAVGVVLPRVLVQKMIPQMRDMSNPDTSKNVFLAPFVKCLQNCRLTLPFKKNCVWQSQKIFYRHIKNSEIFCKHNTCRRQEPVQESVHYRMEPKPMIT